MRASCQRAVKTTHIGPWSAIARQPSLEEGSPGAPVGGLLLPRSLGRGQASGLLAVAVSSEHREPLMTQLLETHRHGDVTVLGDSAEVPGIGHLPVNAYVLHADQPVVVDTGLSTPDKDFVTELSKVIDPADVQWIWITHPDRD